MSNMSLSIPVELGHSSKGLSKTNLRCKARLKPGSQYGPCAGGTHPTWLRSQREI